MRTKLLGAFIAALAVLVLPASALAANGEIRGGPAFNAVSPDLVFTGNNGLQILCEESTLSLEKTGSNTAAVVGSNFEPMPCATNSPRIEVRPEDVRGSISFSGNGTTTTGTASIRFVLRVYDRTIQSTPVAACHYEGEFETTSAAGTGSLSAEGEATYTGEANPFCAASGSVVGNFTLSGGVVVD